MKIAKLALLCALGLAGANALACYTVYDRNNRVVYNELRPPVDMSLPLHQTLPRRFPGGHMVFDVNGECPRVNGNTDQLASARPATGAPAPLLTDVSTAAALRVPHTNVTDTIALVPGYAAARLDLPTYTVIPADATALAAARPAATTMMGAGPTPRAPTAAPAARTSPYMR
ncbi:hypothetical protein [Ramlibacter albus]|uniref:DUF4124 domain-containing protein n=1 Tax=Ramlibacter albus TaxID=2079448 RepID=A0A923MA51_9BURK|nr:hypothetical protein [Ramlibacter albus]MBC5766471.1 hypothetical protein [Ramlibacter albus]